MADATLAIKIVTDYASGAAGLDKASTRAQKFGATMQKLALPAAAVVGGLVAVGTAAVKSASRLEQAMGGVDAVFGKNASTVKGWAADAADSLGLAQSEYGELATLIGSQLRNAGLPLDQVTDKTKGLIETGADLAAMYGGTTAEAVEALSSALKGEMDPMEKYGATLSASAISAKMAADGTDKLTGAAAKSAKTQATLALITEQTALAQGAAAREHDSAAASAQRLSAQFENMKADLGAALLPLMVQFGDALADVAKLASENTTTIQVLAGILGALAVAVLAVNAAMKLYAAGQAVATAATWLFNTALLSSPITWVVIGLVALVAGFVLLYRRSETVRKALAALWSGMKAGARAVLSALSGMWNGVLAGARAVWEWIAANWPLLLGILLGPFGIAVGLIIKNWDQVKAAVAGVVKRIRAAWATIKTGARAAGSAIKAAFTAAFRAIIAAVRAYLGVYRAVFAAIRATTSAVVGRLRAIWSNLWAGIRTGARNLAATLRGIWSGISGAFSTMTGRLRSLWSAALTSLRSKVSGLGAVLSAPFNTMRTAVGYVSSAVSSLIGWVGSLISKLSSIRFPKPPGWMSKIPGVGSLAASRSTPVPLTVGPNLRGYAAGPVPVGMVGAAGSGGGMVQINITGALDPEGVARQIRRILNGHDRRVGVSAR